MVSSFDEGHRNIRKGSADSNETSAAAQKVQLRRATAEIGINDIGTKETTRRHDRSIQTIEGVENVDYDQFFTPATTSYALRGQLTKTRSTLDIRKFFFSQRVGLVNIWNNLPASVVRATSVNMFKNAYDKYIAGEMDV